MHDDGDQSNPERPGPRLSGQSPIPPSFAAEHARLTPGLRRMFLARIKGGDETADDLAQKTWMLVWRALDAGKFDSQRAAFSTFVYAVATNVWRQHLRDTTREKNRDRAAAEAGALPGTLPGAIADPTANADPGDAAASLAETLTTLRNAMAGTTGPFTEDDRWLLRCLADGATDRELAKRLGISASTANDRKQSIFRKLRTFLGQ